MKIREVLQDAVKKFKDSNITEPIIKARILLAHILDVSKEYLIIHSEEEIKGEDIERYNKVVTLVIKGKTLQYITNEQEFMKMKFYVDENVLIPRADTEILVEEVINNCNKNVGKQCDILDLCAGSGAIGVSIAKYIKNSNVVCTDISANALDIAKRNAKSNCIENIKFVQSDMFKEIYDKFDIIVSNPPYIKKDVIPTLDKEVQNEPYIALDGGEDGLDFYRIIFKHFDEIINDVNDERAQKFINYLYDIKKKNGKRLSENTLYKPFSFVRKLFNYFKDDLKIIDYNGLWKSVLKGFYI